MWSWRRGGLGGGVWAGGGGRKLTVASTARRYLAHSWWPLYSARSAGVSPSTSRAVGLAWLLSRTLQHWQARQTEQNRTNGADSEAATMSFCQFSFSVYGQQPPNVRSRQHRAEGSLPSGLAPLLNPARAASPRCNGALCWRQSAAQWLRLCPGG